MGNETFKFQICLNGDSAITLLFDHSPDEELTRYLVSLATELDRQHGDILQEIIPAYQSLTLVFSPLKTTGTELAEQVLQTSRKDFKLSDYQPKLIEIPVCYEPNYAPDLDKVAEVTGLSTKEIIARHCAPSYLVHMLGFTPGFLYLGGLDPKLYCPRKAVPDKKVACRSIGIGGEQTGIYPQATPGGWQIIGRTPIALFNPQQAPHCVAQPLDRIQFVAIDRRTYKQMRKQTK